jgi:hypothetical protein
MKVSEDVLVSFVCEPNIEVASTTALKPSNNGWGEKLACLTQLSITGGVRVGMFNRAVDNVA